MQIIFAVLAASSATAALAATPTLALWANRGSVNTDGDATPDLGDIAPGVPDNQADTDADGIGDAIDPSSATTPYLGDIELGIYPSPLIPAGGAATIIYSIGVNPPHNPAPGDWGHIDLDFGADGIYDATYFGPLTVAPLSFSIPANFFVSPSWNLNTPGTYQYAALGYAPATYSQNEAFPSVIVTPEPATFAALIGVGITWGRRRR